MILQATRMTTGRLLRENKRFFLVIRDTYSDNVWIKTKSFKCFYVIEMENFQTLKLKGLKRVLTQRNKWLFVEQSFFVFHEKGFSWNKFRIKYTNCNYNFLSNFTKFNLHFFLFPFYTCEILWQKLTIMWQISVDHILSRFIADSRMQS